MTFKSEFILIADAFLERDGKLIFAILDRKYSSPILEKTRELERKLGAETALKILHNVEQNGLKDAMRAAQPGDAVRWQLAKSSKQSSKNYDRRGLKYRCTQCSKVFYDLNHEEHKCPDCGRPKNACTRIG